MILCSAGLFQGRRAFAAASLSVALCAVSPAAPVQAAQALATTEMSATIIHDVGRRDADELARLTGELHGATAEAPVDDAEVIHPRALNSAPAPKSDHMYGVLPNYATVEEGAIAPRLTIRQTFQMAALGSFDPYVFPFIGMVTAISHAPRQSFPQRYATALADNSIGNFLTSAVMPTVMRQDPRYFESGHGSIARRVGYAASRSVVTRGRSGQSQFNVSEIGGNAIAAGVSNLYYTPAERTVTGTLTRWGMQVLWDTLSNEMKEFWPDIRHKLHHE